MNHTSGVINDADPSAITIEQARSRVLENLARIRETQTIDVSAALGRVVAVDIISPMSVPSFRASAMDGYAVRASDCTRPLKRVGQSLAGHPGDDHLSANTTQRITTGARVPDGADTVVQQENVELQGDTVIVLKQPQVGLHVRVPGTDSQSGSVLLRAGVRIGAAETGLLAAHGITRVTVVRKLRISVFSTGDELVEASLDLERGQIYDANRALLQALLDEPSCHVTDLGIIKDSINDLQNVFDATHEADLVLSSGGVSVGDADHVKTVLESRGKISLWKIAMKPGRPLTFGLLDAGNVFFGLPGNPVSAALTCLLFVKPAIAYLCGTQPDLVPPLQLVLRGSLSKNPGRVEYQRARMVYSTGADPQWNVTTTGLQDSHVLSSLHKANCLIELPVHSTGASDGDLVTVIPFSHFSRPVL